MKENEEFFFQRKEREREREERTKKKNDQMNIVIFSLAFDNQSLVRNLYNKL
jgi:hypothetical protein